MVGDEGATCRRGRVNAIRQDVAQLRRTDVQVSGQVVEMGLPFAGQLAECGVQMADRAIVAATGPLGGRGHDDQDDFAGAMPDGHVPDVADY